MALFSMLQFPLMMIPNVISSLLEANLAIGRIEDFLVSPEVAPRPVLARRGNEPAVRCRDLTLRWPNGNLLLEGIDFKIPARGQLTLVMGGVGSGKSGFLSALIGEIRPKRGDITVVGSVAYAAQVPWITHATLRENITFGNEFDPVLYACVIEACSLIPDIKSMPHEDRTEIGEKGVNLSGGQKARIALARALYAKADVILLDDPLSAVDAHVMHSLLAALKSKLVKDSAVILASHQTLALSYCDLVLVLDDHRMVFNGAPADYCEKFGVEMQPINEEEVQSCDPGSPNVSACQLMIEKNASLRRIIQRQHSSNVGGNLVKEEGSKRGAMPWQIYEDYMKSCGGVLRCCMIIIGILFTQVQERVF